jgi:DNA-directed RNA polymerase, beta'' subunit/160 kD subunit
VSCETIGDPVEKKKKIVKANQYVDEKIAADLQRIGVEQLKIRSVLTCECGRGVCAMCYGRNLATGDFVKLGEAVGIIAAQSIGEPGTQLTMRTFHIGGTASQTFKQPIIKAKNDGTVQFNDLRTVQALDGSWIVLNKNGSISVHNEEGRELERYNVVVGSVISKEDGASVKKAETFVQWDPYNVPILTDKGGKIEFRDMIAGVTIKREVDEATGLMGTMVIEHKEDLHPQVVIRRQKGGSRAIQFPLALTSSSRKVKRYGRRVAGQKPHAKSQRQRTSRAVCRGLRNCSKLAAEGCG